MKHLLSKARPGLPHALAIPSRRSLRRRPLSVEELRLSPLEPADGPALWQAVESSREHLEQWLPWVAFNTDLRASQRYAEACAVEWDKGRALRLGIRLVGFDDLLGVVSLDNCLHLNKSCDLGYWLAEGATGRGVMTRAAGACLEYGFRELGLKRVRCAAAVGNDRSLGVIQRLGFHQEGYSRQAEFLRGGWVDHLVFSRLDTDPSPRLTG